MLSVRMRFFLVVIYLTISSTSSASIKKSINSLTHQSESPKSSRTKKLSIAPPGPAIIAIEIVDAPETNSSSTKNTSKRTIESSLGYGYRGPNEEPKKQFVIYKYSQRDIPPWNPPPNSDYVNHAFNHNNDGYQNNQINIQKSIEYNLGTRSEYHPASQEANPSVSTQQPMQYYYPGTTLYSSLTHQGQVSDISNAVPYQNVGHNGMVPVIILRVYSNQLSNPNTALHTNLPSTHPYASLNNVNLQNYLQQYLQNRQVDPQYQMPVYQEDYDSNLPTSENYPSKTHTRVIFRSDNNGHIPETKTMYKTPGLSTYRSPVPHLYQNPQPIYVPPQSEMEEASYNYNHQDLPQGYMYVLPNQQFYYPSESPQAYQPDASEDYDEKSPEQETTNLPYNYHAHPSRSTNSQNRSKKNSVVILPTIPPKKRESRNKST